MDIQSSAGEGSPFSPSATDSSSSSSSNTEAVLCAVTAKSAADGPGLRLGLAVFDARRTSFSLVEISSDEHLTALEAILMQVGAVSVLTPSGDSSPWQRRLPFVVFAVGAELIEAKKNYFSQTNLSQDISFLLPPSALKPAAAKELRLQIACDALAALISYWSLASDDSLYHACSLGIYPISSFLNIDAAAAAALHLLPQQQQQRQQQHRILPCSSKYGEAHAAAKDKLSAAAAAAAAAAAGSGAASSVFGLFSRRCCTSLGVRKLHLFIAQPLVDEDEIRKRHDIVEAFMQEVFRKEVFQLHFKHVCELDILSTKLHRIHAASQANKATKKANKMGVGLQDLVKLYDCVVESNSLLGYLKGYTGPGEDTVKNYLFKELQDTLQKFSGFVRLVEHSIDVEEAKQGRFLIDKRFDPRMQQLQQQRKQVLQQLEAERDKAEQTLQLERKREANAVKLILDTTLGFTLRVVKKDQQAVLSRKQHFQTVRLNKTEFLFTTHRLRALAANYKEVEEEYNFLQEALVDKCIQVASTYWPVVERLSELLGSMDALGSFAAVAVSAPKVYVRPVIKKEGDVLHLKACRHALLEVQGLSLGGLKGSSSSSAAAGGAATGTTTAAGEGGGGGVVVGGCNIIANDCYLDANSSRLHVITGPNMGGKSTYIRQVALCVLLAQIGSFVPCDACIMPIFDEIMCRVGASDLQLRGVSTFLAEMVETSAILKNASKKSLIIVDEIGRGTSTYEGFGLAWAVATELASRPRSFTLFATHFLELSALEGKVEGVHNYHVRAAVCKKKRQVSFLYDVKEGHADNSYGVHVAAFAGLPPALTSRAAAISNQLQEESSNQKRKLQHLDQTEEENKTNNNTQDTLKKLRSIISEAFAAQTPQLFADSINQHKHQIQQCLTDLQPKVEVS